MQRNSCALFLVVMAATPAAMFAQEASPTGAFTYEIPVELPEGTNGMQPTLALSYNSHRGNGMLGMGWGLKGISYVIRDRDYGIDFDSGDHFIHEGEKIIHDPANSRYHKEREDYTRIQAINLNTSSSYWRVTKKDGTKLFYGYTADSHIDAVDKSGKALLWALCYVVDTNGNYLHIEYSEDATNGDFYPTRITYTDNITYPTTACYTVDFIYEARDDHWAKYQPTLVDMDQRLKWIKVKVNGNLLRQYRLDYEYGTSSATRSRLITVQEYGSDGTSTLPAVTFDWENGADGSFGSWIDTSTGKYRVAVGDFDGDGMTDLLKYIEQYGENPNNNAYIALSDGDGTFGSWQLVDDVEDCVLYVGDYDGDGKSDIAKLCFDADAGDYGHYSIEVKLATGSGNFGSWKYVDDFDGIEQGAGHQLSVGDFNGSGKSDLVLYVKNGYSSNIVKVKLATGSGNFGSWKGVESQIANKYGVGDFNGDGKTDLLGYEWAGNGDYVKLATGNGYFGAKQYLNHPDNNDRYAGSGDFNGDGMADAVRYDAFAGDELLMVLSKGYGTFESNWRELDGAWLSDYVYGDFNGDGLTDICRFSYWGGTVDLDEKLATGGGNFSNWIEIDSYTGNVNNGEVLVGDFNGDGLHDMAHILETGAGGKVKMANGKTPDLLTKIYNRMGGTYTVTYKPAPGLQNAIIPSASSSPYIANPSSINLVSNIRANDGLGGTISTSYGYNNGQVFNGDLERRTSVGFEWIKRTNDSTGNYRKTYYNHSRTFRFLISEETSYDSSGNIYAKSTYSYSNRTTGLPYGVEFVYLTDRFNYIYDGDDTYIEMKESYEYDDYGNLSQRTKHGQTYPDLLYDKMQIITDYAYNRPLCIINKPKRVRIFGYDANNGWVKQKDTANYYDNLGYGQVNRGNLTTKKEQIEGTTLHIVTHSNDNWGNRISTTDGEENSTSFTYDRVCHSYLLTKTDAKGFDIKFTYDNLGRLETESNRNRVLTNYRYDVFSRSTKTYRAPDTVSYPTKNLSYSFDGTAPEYVLGEDREEALTGGVFMQKSFYDGLGRVIQMKKEFDGTGYITVDYYYNGEGSLEKKSVPYIESSFDYTSRDTAQRYTLTEYDPAGRAKKITKPDTTYVRTIYLDNIVKTVDENNHVITKTFDGLGNVIEVKEHERTYPSESLYSTTTYDYNTGTGQVVRVTDHGGNITMITYDLLGRRQSIDDPDMGLWSYTYDNNSNLEMVVDARNSIINFTYDELNRNTVIDYPSGTDSYFYYDETEHGKSNGKLTRAVYAAGTREIYYNDVRGRVSKETVTIDGVTKSESLTYDSMDRVRTLKYPDNETVTYAYNIGNNLETAGGTYDFVTDINYGAFGKVTDLETHAGGLTTYYNYYDSESDYDQSAGTYYSYRIKEIYTSTPSIYDISYEYDKAGNVKKKNDLNDGNFSEHYSYDDLNRLSHAYAGVYGSKNFSYDEIGNLSQKDNEIYTYSSGRPHAVTQKGGSTFSYDDNGNMSIGHGRIYDYDYNNMLVSATGGFSYDYFGERRVKKVENGITSRYFFDDYEEEDDGSVNAIKYYFAGDKKIARWSTDDGLLYYHQDHLGSSVRITQSDLTVVKSLGYKPYGSDSYSTGSAPINFKFTGQEEDDTGLYYYGARYYDADLGRFISADTLVPGQYNPQDLNRYSYCLNNPVVCTDPSGHYGFPSSPTISSYTTPTSSYYTSSPSFSYTPSGSSYSYTGPSYLTTSHSGSSSYGFPSNPTISDYIEPTASYYTSAPSFGHTPSGSSYSYTGPSYLTTSYSGSSSYGFPSNPTISDYIYPTASYYTGTPVLAAYSPSSFSSIYADTNTTLDYSNQCGEAWIDAAAKEIQNSVRNDFGSDISFEDAKGVANSVDWMGAVGPGKNSMCIDPNRKGFLNQVVGKHGLVHDVAGNVFDDYVYSNSNMSSSNPLRGQVGGLWQQFKAYLRENLNGWGGSSE